VTLFVANERYTLRKSKAVELSTENTRTIFVADRLLFDLTIKHSWPENDMYTLLLLLL
jgi:hypothetical protein